MTKKKATEPDFDFEIESGNWRELQGKATFTTGLTIVKCLSGVARIALNSYECELRAGINFLLTDTILFQVMELSDDFEVICYKFSPAFCNDVYPMLDDKVIDVTAYSAPDLYTKEILTAADLALRQIDILYVNKEHSYRTKLAKSLLIVYIHEIYEITRPHINTLRGKSTNYNVYVISRFYELVHEHYLAQKSIRFYADELNISTRYLYKITMHVLKMTPKELIDYYVIAEAKKMLLTTIMTSQQIADKLHFSDQSAFGQYFKRNVGISPIEYRNSYK
ncbi:MAG: helix-turn-helix domain-containing protein [Bacteroidales bacterium]